MLIIFAAYLEAQKRSRFFKMTFQEWMAARPEILAARDAARQNPAGALAPLPALQAPNLWLNTEGHNSKEVCDCWFLVCPSPKVQRWDPKIIQLIL